MEGLYRSLAIVAVLIAGLQFGGSDDAQPVKNSSHVLHDQDQQCPMWFFRNQTSHECECGPELLLKVYCSQAKARVSIDRFRCLTYDNQTESTAAVLCPFSYLEAEGVNVPLPEN